MLVSYILVGFKSRQFVAPCIRSILADTPGDSEIIFIDNASRDGTVEMIAADFPAVKLIRNQENIGHCRATNQGLRAAKGRFIMHLDTDTELAPGTMATLLTFLESNPGVKLVAPRMLNGDGTIQETARRFPSLVNALFGRQTLLARLFPSNPFTVRYLGRENLSRTEPFAVDWVSAACMMFPRTTLDEVGEWDEQYAGYWVDCDWCKLIQNKGGPIYCVPAARVSHYEQNRAGVKKSPLRIRMFNKGAHRFFVKHHTWGWWDPRALLAGAMLRARTAAQLFVNFFARPA